MLRCGGYVDEIACIFRGKENELRELNGSFGECDLHRQVDASTSLKCHDSLRESEVDVHILDAGNRFDGDCLCGGAAIGDGEVERVGSVYVEFVPCEEETARRDLELGRLGTRKRP